MLGTYHMTALLEALSDLHHIHDPAYLYTFVLNRCSDVLKAQGGTFFSVRDDLGELIPQASKGVALSLLKEIPFKIKTGVSGWVASNHKAAVVENPQADPRFSRAVDVITGIKTRSILCVPVMRKDKLMGVIELVNRVDGVFHEADLEFLQQLANQLGVALENSQLYSQTSELLAYTSGIINSLSGGFISIDTKENVTRCNIAACRILGITEKDMVGKPLLKTLPQFPAFAAILDVTQRNQVASFRQEIELQKPDGSPMVLGYSTFLIRSESNAQLGAGLIFQDITHLKRK